MTIPRPDFPQELQASLFKAIFDIVLDIMGRGGDLRDMVIERIADETGLDNLEDKDEVIREALVGYAAFFADQF